MELEATWGRTTKIWWSYLWKYFLAILGCFIIVTILMFIIGYLLALMGVSQAAITFVGTILGFLLFFPASLIPIKYLLNKNYGNFRLALLPISQYTSTKPEQ
jgi:hypothetical protein